MTYESFDIQHLYDPPKFLADENVKGLARWLRFLGYDTAIAQGSDEVVRLETQRSGRCLITRDAELASQLRHHSILLKTDRLEDQIKTVLKNAPRAEVKTWFSRCVECNHALQELTAAEIETDSQIPDFVKGKPGLQAWTCPSCNHSYWKGSHVERMQGYFNNILSDI